MTVRRFYGPRKEFHPMVGKWLANRNVLRDVQILARWFLRWMLLGELKRRTFFYNIGT